MARGTLRILLGAAPGVGKTYTMLEEAHQKVAQGVDTVVALAIGPTFGTVAVGNVLFYELVGPRMAGMMPSTKGSL